MSSEKSEMRDFYKGKSVLITGVTGFIGKVLLFKLLKSLPDIDHVYVLVRSKKNVNFQKRVSNLLESEIFESVQKSDLIGRVEAIEGDIGLPKLGLSENDEQKLIDDVHIVFHVAATVRFNEPVRKAMQINLIGTMQMIELSRKMKHMQSFVHVSTAYCNSDCDDHVVYERIYPTHVDVDDFMQMINSMGDDELNRLEKKHSKRIFGNKKNTYVLTKGLTEFWLQKHASDLPISIVRPSMVPYCAQEPVPGYVDNIFTTTAHTAAAYIGFSSIYLGNTSISYDLVTADYVVKCLLAAAKYRVDQIESSRLQRSFSNSQIFVCHCTASESMAFSNQKRHLMLLKFFDEYPLKNAVWLAKMSTTESEVMYKMMWFFYDYLPCLLAHIPMKLFGSKINLLDVQMKMYKANTTISYFHLNSWSFKNDNLQLLKKQLSDVDREQFYLDDSLLDENVNVYVYLKGIRKYIFKENEDTLYDARQKQVLLIILDFARQLIFYLLLLKLIAVVWRRTLCRKVSERPLELSYVHYDKPLIKDTNYTVEPLIVLHGLFGSKSNWNGMCKAMHSKFEPHRSVMAIDQRNHGESPHHDSHTYNDLIADLKFLLNSLAISKVSLLGHSMGGRTAMFFSLHFPYFVEKLIVVDISPVSSSSNMETLPFLATALEMVKLPKNVKLSNARVQVNNQLKEIITDHAIRSFLLTNLIQDSIGTVKWRLNIKALKENFEENIYRFPETKYLQFDGKTLFIKGENSDFLPESDYDEIKTLFPNAIFKTMPNVGHWAHADNPKLFLDIVLEFLNEK